MNKKPYTTPKMTVHGDIEEITLQGVLQNADVPSGTNNAFPPGGGGGGGGAPTSQGRKSLVEVDV